jgi:Protein of unknown function (DUF3800)
MPTFIDESGDTGPVSNGSTPYFHLAAVWVPTHDVASAFREKIQQLRRTRGWRAGYEFKFAKTHDRHDQRVAFLATALTVEFNFIVSSLDKTTEQWLSADSQDRHWACATELAAVLRPVYCQAEARRMSPLREPVIVDDNRDGNFLSTIKQQFRGLHSQVRPGASMTGKVSFRASATDEMLRLADMICGVVGDMIQTGNTTRYNLIARRDLDRRHHA